MDTTACLDETTLVRFFAGDLPMDRLATVEQHLDGCVECGRLIEAAAPLLAGSSGRGRLLELPALVERGQLVVGRYRIEALIGHGACGYVLRARDELAGLTVAVKLLRAERALQPVLLQLFTRELRVARALHHPHVCRVFDLQVCGEDRFLVMELASGSLRDELRSGAAAERTPDQQLVDAEAIAAGLSAIHDAGIIHRDVKPENVLRLPDGRLVVSDFGLATLAPLGSATRYVGTPLYMAPEVAAGEPATRASDIYSLGLVLHELFFGRRPSWRSAGGRRVLDLAASLRGRRQRSLHRLIAACLADAAEQRPADARLLIRQLQAIRQGRDPGVGSWPRPGRRAVMATLSAGLLLGGATFSLVRHAPGRRMRRMRRVGRDFPVLPGEPMFDRARRASFAGDGLTLLNRAPGPGFDLVEGHPTRAPLSDGGHDAVLSPDGRLVVFVGDPAPDAPMVTDVWLLERESGRQARVSIGSFPSWSPEGKLYFHDFRNRSVMYLNTQSPHQRQPMVFFGRSLGPYPSVSPDGKRIAFGRTERLLIVDSYDATETLRWPAPGRRGLLPCWSPDGTVLAFSSLPADPLGVWVLDPSLQRAVRVSTEASGTPAWTPDGASLTYDRTEAGTALIYRTSTREIRRWIGQGLDPDEFESFCLTLGEAA